MNTRFKTLLVTGAMALALIGLNGAAVAKGDDAATKAAVDAVRAALEGGKGVPPQEMSPEVYAKNHEMVVHVFTSFRDGLKQPIVAGNLASLRTELDKLPSLEKAYIDAKNAGDEAAAKKAADDYELSVNKVVAAALPLDRVVKATLQKYMETFDALGKDGAKLKAEPDLAALLAEIELLMKPLDDANAQVGPMQSQAATDAQKRFVTVRAKIIHEEIAAAALKDLLSASTAASAPQK
jgi:hypothetical protein